MAVGSIGNTIFTNQMTPVVSNVHNSHTNRIEFQNMIAQTSVNEKDEKVLKVRPAEENHEINPDREHTKNEADQENARSEKREEENDEKEEERESESEFSLDIMV